jgi:hypothetical protein
MTGRLFKSDAVVVLKFLALVVPDCVDDPQTVRESFNAYFMLAILPRQ